MNCFAPQGGLQPVGNMSGHLFLQGCKSHIATALGLFREACFGAFVGPARARAVPVMPVSGTNADSRGVGNATNHRMWWILISYQSINGAFPMAVESHTAAILARESLCICPSRFRGR